MPNADLKATYRLVSNPKVSMTEIFSYHNQATMERCSTRSRVYLCQDTTEFDLTKPKQAVRGAGPLGTDKWQGFFYHPLYALAEDGLPLGVVDQVVWTRDPASLEVPADERKAERKKACFKEKESSRWLEMMQSGEQISRCLPDVQFVMVAESESDIGELFCEAPDLADNYDFIIRQSRQHLIADAIDSHTGESLAAKATFRSAGFCSQPYRSRQWTICMKSLTDKAPDSSCEKYFTAIEWMAILAYLRRPCDPKKHQRCAPLGF